jgi:hypothetical protein
MYVESKSGHIDGAPARIGWVTFSKSGRSVYYRGLSLLRAKGGGLSGNFIDAESGEEYWVSGVKQSGSNTHPAEARIKVVIDDDAMEALQLLRGKAGA